MALCAEGVTDAAVHPSALRIASIIIVAKAVLIGVVYWRRAEILAAAHSISERVVGAALIAVVTIGVAIAATVYVASRDHKRTERPDSP